MQLLVQQRRDHHDDDSLFGRRRRVGDCEQHRLGPGDGLRLSGLSGGRGLRALRLWRDAAG